MMEVDVLLLVLYIGAYLVIEPEKKTCVEALSP